MRLLTTDTDPQVLIGLYGPDWSRGLLSEQVDLFTAAGGVVRPSLSGAADWAVLPDGTAYPVVCSEIIRVDTEDGPVSGRCGSLATDAGCCDDHAEIVAFWRGQSDAETAAWERDLDAR